MKFPANLPRRAVIAAAVLSIATVTAAHAQTGVTKVIVPFTPGGISDVIARTLLERMSRELGQTMIVENRPGGGGRIGSEVVMRAPADGNTLLFTNSSYSILPIVDSTARYEPSSALAPVVLAGTYGLPIVVSNKLPVNSLQSLIDYARKNPGKLSYGSAGQGSGTHFAGEYFKVLTQTQMVHVPYKSTAAAAADVASGLLDLTFDAASKPYADAGKVKIIAVTGRLRDPRLRDVPTAAEAGLKPFVLDSWVGLLAPAATPPAVIERLNHAAATALADPGLRKALNDLGVNPAGGPPARLAQMIADDNVLYRKIVKDAQLKVE